MSKKAEKGKKDEKDKAERFMNVAKGMHALMMIGVTLFALAILAVLVYVGVRLGQWLVPLFTNA